MRDLIFHIKGQYLSVETYPKTIVANSINYLRATFIFDDYGKNDFEWENNNGEKFFIHAEFSWNGINKWAKLELENGRAQVNVPWEVIKTPGFSVNVFCTTYEGDFSEQKIKKRVTTRPVPILVNASGDINGVPGAPESGDVNLFLLIDEAYNYSKTAFELAKEAKEKVDYLEDKVEQKQVSIGGVNILNNSKNIPLYSNDSSKWPISKETLQEKNRTFTRYRRINTSLNSSDTLTFYNNIYYKDFTEILPKDYVTFSFLARANLERTASLMAYVTDPDGGLDRIDFSKTTETIKLSNDWKRYSITVKLEQDFTQSAIFRFCPYQLYFIEDTDSKNFYLDICEWKVERGVVATEWTPSLAETDLQITEVKTSLRQEVDQIIGEVEAEISTLEGTYSQVNSRVQTLESTTSIISKETYGMNILKDSGFYTPPTENWWGRTGFEITDDGAKITSYTGQIGQSILGKLKKDATYTASVKVKIARPSSTGTLQIIDNGVINGSWFAIGSKKIDISTAKDWQTYYYTFKTDYRVDSAANYEFVFDWRGISANAEIYFKEFKLELGSWPTAWSEGASSGGVLFSKIEQTADSLKTEIGDVEKKTNSKITQLSEEINLEVNNLDDKLSSQIELIPGQINLAVNDLDNKLSSQINLISGKITSEVSSLDSKLSSKIEQTEKDLTAKIDGVKEGQTDYIRFSEEGLIVGDWVGSDKTGLLGGNIKIASDFGVPEIQLRNNDNLYATFSPGSIRVGLDENDRNASGIYLREGVCSLVTWKEGMNAENETTLSALHSDFLINVTDNNDEHIQLGILPSDYPHIYINSSSSEQETIAMDWQPDSFSMDFGRSGSIDPVILKGFSMNVEFSGAGYITNGGKRVCFTIPINKAIPTSVQTVTVESNSGLKIRQNGDYIYADDNDFVTPTKYSGYITYLYSNSILIYADFETTKSPYKNYISKLINNDACGVQASLTLTFS